MKILLDCDEILTDLCYQWIYILNRTYGLNVKYEDIHCWNMQKIFPTLSEEQIYNPLILESFWHSVKPVCGSQRGVQELLSMGHDIYIVTASHYKTLEHKGEWLEKYFPEIDWDNVIVAKNKSMVNGDVFIDDGLHNLICGDYDKIVFDKPWNRNASEVFNRKIKRVYNWDEIVEVIKQIDK